MIDIKEILRRFAIELNNRMDECEVTYRQVAFAARVTRGSMIHYKSGNAFPELYPLVLMAEYLDCRVDDLLGYLPCCGFTGGNIVATKRFKDEDDFADYFRLRLYECMQEKAVDTNELARRAAVSTNTIDMYLSVHRWVPRTVDFIYICDALDCTPSELLGY